jgi:hypothetical protein
MYVRRPIFICMYTCILVYKGWAMKSGPCTATFNDLVFIYVLVCVSFMKLYLNYAIVHPVNNNPHLTYSALYKIILLYNFKMVTVVDDC